MSKILAEAFVQFAGADWHAPSFIDIVYPESKKDEPTAEEIKDHVLSLLE